MSEAFSFLKQFSVPQFLHERLPMKAERIARFGIDRVMAYEAELLNDAFLIKCLAPHQAGPELFEFRQQRLDCISSFSYRHR